MRHAESKDTEHGAGIKQKPHHGLEQWTYILEADVAINTILLVFYGLEAILQLFIIATFLR
ncbi:unnamed protein product [Ranitomeya imitator]|uniref:Uncharacterized protein n=1 Tax=Ranitomeya imitator TaxID=111125 RepID=A0ABN9LMN7_9NEOB|nr:unnamed protein product [Ranitomeya imitator]